MCARFLVPLPLSFRPFAGRAQAEPAGTALVFTARTSEVEGSQFKATLLSCGSPDGHLRSVEASQALRVAGANIAMLPADTGRAR